MNPEGTPKKDENPFDRLRDALDRGESDRKDETIKKLQKRRHEVELALASQTDAASITEFTTALNEIDREIEKHQQNS